jgi:amino acid transporter
MVAFMATLLVYIVQQLFPAGSFIVTAISSVPGEIVIAVIFSAVVGFIAMRGVTGSTNVSIIINVIQLTALAVFSVLAIAFRSTNPLQVAPEGWYHPTAISISSIHNLAGLLFQSTIAILILVGFESSTAFGAEAKNPKRDIPRGVIISLVIQGLLAYLFEYFAANYAMNDKLTFTAADGTLLHGIAAAGASGAPIGDLAVQVGNAMLGGNGFALMIILAITVAIAILGTTLAAMNTGVRISFAMAQDNEMPEIMGLLHGKYATPYVAVVIMVIVSAIIGAIGVAGGVVALTGVTLASNLGTFVLYAMICAVTVIAFMGRPEFNILKHGIVPVVGLILNVVMVLAIFVIGILTGGSTAQSTYLALGIAAAWLAVSVAYFVVSSRQRGIHIVPPTATMSKPSSAGD